jgi:hypothetical protein
MKPSHLGWSLVGVSLFLLAARGELSLLVLLVPAAAGLGFGFLWLAGARHNRPAGIK